MITLAHGILSQTDPEYGDVFAVRLAAITSIALLTDGAPALEIITSEVRYYEVPYGDAVKAIAMWKEHEHKQVVRTSSLGGHNGVTDDDGRLDWVGYDKNKRVAHFDGKEEAVRFANHHGITLVPELP